MSCKPTSFHLLERENHTNLITWTYPTIHEDLKTIISQTCFSEGLEAAELFYYKRLQKCWIYIKQFAENDSKKAVILTSQSYRPNLYKTLCNFFVRKYINGSNGVDLVKLYLKIYISNGICLKENLPETFVNLNDFPWSTDLKGVIKNLGIETILLYNALLLKKQILVYHPDVEELQQGLDSITRLGSFRRSEDILEPLVQNISDCKKKSAFYLTGTINSTMLTQQNLFDLLVNLQSRRINVSSKCTDSFQMSSLHKEVAHLMMQLAESETTEIEVIESISKKTVDIFKYLKTFESTKEGEMNTMLNNIESKIKNQNLQKFLINLAIAENFRIIV